MYDLIVLMFAFIGSFYILTKASDFFIDEAASLGKQFGMSKLMIGLTIVAVGTSFPETITSIMAIFISNNNFSEFVVGTTMGSNITNLLLAFGLYLVVAGNFHTHKKETFNLISLLFVTIVFSIFVILGFINYLFILMFVFYLFYVYYQKTFLAHQIVQKETEIVEIKKHTKLVSVTILILSFCSLFLGAQLAIGTINALGVYFAIPTAYLTLTTISIATSLPEIAVTVSAARKKEYLIGIGNILGTNIMNVCIIIGLSALTGYYSVETYLYRYSLVFFLLGTIIFSYIVYRERFKPIYGYFFLFLYCLYILSFFLG